ncbi:MAG: zinc ribbon domain-containing protein [Ruminococcaceae bacterium]|nr:zinc ribbon domain-containing protein [Oscillospiraceae bacterium]
MFCEHCGKHLADNQAFCDNCGTSAPRTTIVAAPSRKFSARFSYFLSCINEQF